MTRLAQVTVPASGLAESKAFFGDLLGLPHLFDAPNVVAFDAGGVRLLLVATSVGSETGGPTPFFTATDIIARHADLLRRGAADRGAPHCVAVLDKSEVWVAFVADPSGTTIGLIEEHPRKRGESQMAEQ